MYWVYLLIFILAVLTPDIIQRDFYGVDQERVEEAMIFLLGLTGVSFFIIKEYQLLIQKKEQEKNLKRLDQTVKDLAESYSYIGEVNRKMDILMQVSLGISDRASLNKKQEKEIYYSILNASNFLMKGDCAFLRFVNIENNKLEKEVKMSEGCPSSVKNSELTEMKEGINIKKDGKFLIIASHQKIRNIKSFLIIYGYSEQEEKSPNNVEILKVLASQALFLYSYSAQINKKS